jgi:hypothetical protein
MKIWLCLVVGLWSAGVLAHKPSDSYLTIEITPNGPTGRWDIALRDLDYALGLDADDDGAITWGELRRRESDVAAYALARLALRADDRDCPLEPMALLADEHSDGGYAVLPFAARCATPSASLAVDYRLFFDLDPQHRGLFKLVDGGGARAAVLSPAAARRDFGLAAAREEGSGLPDFIQEGVRHIWIGYDHILFLLSLLLPAVLERDRHGWKRAEHFRQALWDAVGVVTAFTLAHSITLGLAALHYVDLPSRWVESAIAASVIAAALNNLAPVLHRRRPLLAFGFGLVHGLGFASVLSDLALPASARLLGLVGFNLGVELGQLAIVGVFLPIAYLLSRHGLYQTAILRAGSLAILVLAANWLAERALNQPLLALFG